MKNKTSYIFSLILLLLVLSSFLSTRQTTKLIAEGRKTMRASFCLYNDGKFYETFGSGCTGQGFCSGNWRSKGDTVLLEYDTTNIFTCNTLTSIDSSSEFQIVRIIDCYNQPVRFQYINHNKGFTNLYNMAYIKLEKKNNLNYPKTQIFIDPPYVMDYVSSNSDTITYKWNCNRESIESISGGNLFFHNEFKKGKAVYKNGRIQLL